MRARVSLDKTAILSVVANRPLLSLCLALGSPAVYIDRSFHYRNEIEALSEATERLPDSSLIFAGGFFAVLIEHIIALASVANVATLSWQLGVQVSYSVAHNSSYLPALWAYLGVVIHLWCAFALCLRAKVNCRNQEGSDATAPTCPQASVFKHLLVCTPLQKQQTIEVGFRPPSLPYVLLNQISGAVAALHVMFGTVLFSGILFIGVRDAVYVALRYMASAVACRIVVSYRLAVIREGAHIKIITLPTEDNTRVDYVQ